MRLRKMIGLLGVAGSAWVEDNAMRLSAAVAYYALFSLTPLLAMGISVAGLVFGEQAARGETAEEFRRLAGANAGNAILSFLHGAGQRKASMLATFAGLLILLFGASGVFSELKAALNTIWGVTIKPGRAVLTMIRERLFAFAMVLSTGFLLLVSLALSAALSALGKFEPDLPSWPPSTLQFVDNVISLLVATFLFALLFRILPNVELRWRDVGIGAAVTGFLFTVGKFLIGFYLGTTAIASYYGAAGSAIVFLLWVYYSACILFFGAEFTKAYVEKFGAGIKPDKRAMFRTGKSANVLAE